MRAFVIVSLVMVGGMFSACGGVPVDAPSTGAVEQATKNLPPGCHEECPKCKKGEVCPKIACRIICHGNKTACGDNFCNDGEYCCNESCGICAPFGALCIQQFCGPAQQCQADADCRLFSDYCTGCDCRALGPNDADPVCEGPGVRCFADPCQGKTAACVNGACVAQ